MEATIGAIFLDGGFEPAKTFVLNYILNDIEHKQLFYDSKTILQELIQGETDEENIRIIREAIATNTPVVLTPCYGANRDY